MEDYLYILEHLFSNLSECILEPRLIFNVYYCMFVISAIEQARVNYSCL